jgi:methanol metabolism-related c-type cytochrome
MDADGPVRGALATVELLRPCRRLLWRAALAAVVVSLGSAPAPVHAQAAGGADPSQTEEREAVVEEGADTGDAWEDKPYTVVDGKVDFGTYNGYRRYHSHCHVCHGPDGLGSSYAPALIESIPQIGYEGYLEAVIYGVENVDQSQQSVMPAFGEVEDVVNYVDDIYSYLKARADGVLGRGRPERLPK